MKLRWHLLVLTLVTLAPIVGFGIVASKRLVDQERDTFERGARERTRAMLTAVDAELKGAVAMLDGLAVDESLDTGDLRAFHARAARVLARRPDWLTITLAVPSGSQLVDAARPFGREIPVIRERASFETVLRTRAPVVGGLKSAWLTDELDFAVRVPVMRGGDVKYVLSGFVKPQSLSALLAEQRLPADWVGVLLDGDARIIARTVAPERTVGTLASESLRAALDRAPEGWFRGSTVEGRHVYTPYARSPWSGFTVAMGIPAEVVESAGRKTGWAMAAGVAAATLTAFALSVAFGRRIAAPISATIAAVQAIGRGEAPRGHVRGRVAEVDVLASALYDASAVVRAREDALREADRRKDEFLALLSHELRTPINAVYGWARMLKTGTLPDDARGRALDTILRNANAQVQLIDDLLEVSRIIAGKTRLDVRAIDLVAVIEAALDAVRPAAYAKGVHLQPALDPIAGPITGDPGRLQQVVWNLLINAVKFTPKGGTVAVHLHRLTSHVEIVVSDTGAGIAAEMLPVIFERFRQADSSTTRRHSGLGLGLALVRHLVELHGGSVVARSDGEGQGATFVVTLPVALAPAEDTTAPRVELTTIETSVAAIFGPALQGVRVLVVDDDPDGLGLATSILAAAGAHVRARRSAADALAAFEASRPDVLVADIEMPGEDGLSLIRKIRGMEGNGAPVPAVALTAYGRAEDRVRTLAAGFSMHVPKPVDPAELVTIVASLAGREARPRS